MGTLAIFFGGGGEGGGGGCDDRVLFCFVMFCFWCFYSAFVLFSIVVFLLSFMFSSAYLSHV